GVGAEPDIRVVPADAARARRADGEQVAPWRGDLDLVGHGEVEGQDITRLGADDVARVVPRFDAVIATLFDPDGHVGRRVEDDVDVAPRADTRRTCRVDRVPRFRPANTN